jgi:NAD+ diphosphatase
VDEPNAYTGAEVDRAGDGRRADPDWVEAQLRDPAARAIVGGDAGFRAGERLELATLDEAAANGAGAEPVLLGIGAGGPLWALDEQPHEDPGRRRPMIGAGGRRGEPAPAAAGRVGLRDAASALPAADAALAAYAAGLLNWHRSHRFCANCGMATESAEGGFVRRCPRCGAAHHPRTDPVVIMLVVDGDRALLGRQASWPARRYSALAGFVGPGESLEEAVGREVREEAGVAVGSPAYRGSQPWPFPASLMIGFVVPWRRGEPGGADPELQDVRWFGREEIAAATRTNDPWTEDAAGAGLMLPPRSAIARRLIEGWVARG